MESQRPSSLPLATLLSVESIKRYPTLEADQFLRHGLPLLPDAVGRPMQHHGPVHKIVFSPDGKRVATGSWDGTAGVWDPTTGRQLFTVTNGQVNDRIASIAFSPDSQLMATISSSGSAQIWDATTGRAVGQLIGLGAVGQVKTVAFSPDGSRLATVTENGADVWSVNGNPAKIFSTPPLGESFFCTPLSSFSFSPDGKHAAAGCRGLVRIWETASWNTLVTIPRGKSPGLRPPLHPIAFSPDGKYLASADEVYEVATGTLVSSLHSEGAVSAVVFSPLQDYLAVVAGDIVSVVDLYTWTQVAELHHDGAVQAVVFSPSGNEVATASDDNTARIWEVHRYSGDGPTREVSRMVHRDTVLSVDFSPDGKYLATASEDRTARVWQVMGKREVGREVYGDTKASYCRHWRRWEISGCCGCRFGSGAVGGRRSRGRTCGIRG